MKMLDVYSGDNIKDFDQLKASGMPICTKVSEGRGWTDKYYDYRYNECKKRGIPISFYHMLTKNPDVEGQAVDFWNEVKNYDNDMLNMLDIEYENIPDAEEYANRFIAKYKELSGQDILVYSYRSYFQERFSQSFLNTHYLWVADYCSRQPNFPNLVVWQYSESCRDFWWVGNDEGCVDINNVLMEDVLFRHGASIPVVANNTTTQYNVSNGKIAELQRIAGVEADGIYGPETDNAISGLIAGIPYKTPELTKWIQARVGCSIDGVYGQITADSVKGWQFAHGLYVDGVAGYNTIKSLALA